jgi:hypothetical protein
MVESVTNVDGPGLRSFAWLVWPAGRLTQEFLAGRRASVLPPFRLYLLCSLAFVLAREFRDLVVGSTSDQLLKVTTTIQSDDGSTRVVRGDSAIATLLDSTQSGADPLGSGWFGRTVRRALAEPAAFQERVRAEAPKAFFLLVPSFALLLQIGFRRSQWHYPRHLLVALHIHAAGFLLFAAGQLVASLPGLLTAASAVGALASLLYTPIALRRVYEVSSVRAIVTFVLIAVPYLNVVALATAAVIGLAARG